VSQPVFEVFDLKQAFSTRSTLLMLLL